MRPKQLTLEELISSNLQSWRVSCRSFLGFCMQLHIQVYLFDKTLGKWDDDLKLEADSDDWNLILSASEISSNEYKT